MSNPRLLRVPPWRVLSELTGRHSRSGSKSPSNRQPEEDPKHVKAIVNKQYNSPIGLYSHTNAEDTRVVQAREILMMIG